METVRVTELNNKRYTFFFMGEEDKNLGLIYSKDDQSKTLGELTLVKPSFKSKDHPKWYEITVYDPTFENMKLLGRIQVEDI